MSYGVMRRPRFSYSTFPNPIKNSNIFSSIRQHQMTLKTAIEMPELSIN